MLDMLFAFLPEGPKLYDEEIICDQPLDNLLSDLVREQVLINTREEVPHSVAVKIEKIEEMKRKNGKSFTAILATYDAITDDGKKEDLQTCLMKQKLQKELTVDSISKNRKLIKKLAKKT